MIITNSFKLTLVILLLTSCNKNVKFDQLAETNNILKLHNAQRDHHFKKDSVAFVNQLSKNFISVNRGEISMPTKKETIKRYHKYFSNVKFTKWDDVSAPIIRFSDDGSMAYCVVNKIVIVTYEDKEGEIFEDQTHFAWTTIYKKYNNTWKIDCVTSTEKSKN